MRKTAFFHDEQCFWHSGGLFALTLPVGGWVEPPSGSAHAESPESKRRLKNLVEVSGLGRSLDHQGGEPVSLEQMLRVHTPQYLHRFRQLCEAGGGLLDPGAPVGPSTYEIARVSAGLVCNAVRQVLQGHCSNAYVLSRPPGHHCLPDQAMGFCYLNNIAIAIEEARAHLGLQRVAVIDWDVHHGNGTQSIFYERSDVLSISIHQQRAYPRGYTGEDDIGSGAGYGYNLNLALPPGSGHETYMHAMQQLVLPALERFEPELIMVACGFDASGVDPLGRMLLHSDSYRQMTRMLREAAERLCQGRLVLAHEGGYAEAYVPFCGLATIEALSGLTTEVLDPMLEMLQAQQPDAHTVAFQQAVVDTTTSDLRKRIGWLSG
ncbi:class II histone deacetylase [Pseudomonas sp. LRF_L74]|uniref:class II histone deacetylase n=1 Tax=Pseudomonas sp. LRF_L74 TaxID=3369422 RepID=UPI003F625994